MARRGRVEPPVGTEGVTKHKVVVDDMRLTMAAGPGGRSEMLTLAGKGTVNSHPDASTPGPIRLKGVVNIVRGGVSGESAVTLVALGDSRLGLVVSLRVSNREFAHLESVLMATHEMTNRAPGFGLEIVAHTAVALPRQETSAPAIGYEILTTRASVPTVPAGSGSKRGSAARTR